jgi:aminopeptidase N
LDEKSRRFALENLSTIKDDFLRTLLWGTLWDSVREAELDPGQYLELGIKLAPSETDEVTVQSVLGRMSTAFNRYLSDAQAREVAPRLESLLTNQMEKAPTAGLRITYFRAFQSVASTEAGLGSFKRLLSGELKVPGMTLRSRDRFDIITALLARNDSEALALLKAEGERAQTDDDKRYAYAAAAAREDPTNKKAYFDAYQTDTKLPESWIEASLGPFNSIHQSALTQPYLAPALAELPRLKRTRKIFFVNNWLAAFIGGQCDQQALSTVKEFLDQQPTLDRDLRLKVLESSDGLERCVKIRGKYGK